MAPIELFTEDKLQYRWFPAGPSGIVLRVKAANDAHIALSTQEEESNPFIEVFFGGWGNKKSVIRRDRTKPEVAEAETPEILSKDEFRGFWIRWDNNGNITAGREGEATPILSYDNPSPFPIRFVGVCTGWGASGSWVVDQPAATGAVWVQVSGSAIPAGACVGGHDNGEDLVVGRAAHEGGLIPGKVVPSHGVCYIPWGGGEHGKNDYEVLVGQGNWVPGAGSDIPPNAIPAGESEDGEPLFVGRAHHEGTLTVGKVQPSHGACYISYAGQELAFNEFEVLVV